MSDRVPLRPAGDVRDPQLSLAGIRPAQVPGAAPPSNRLQAPQDGPGLDTLAGAMLGFVGDRLVKQEVERAVDAARAEPIQRDADNNLIIPDMERSFWDTAADEQVRAVRAGRYAVEFGLQNEAALVRLRADNPDPQAFALAAAKWRDATLATVPAAARGPMAQAVDKLIGQHRSHMAEEQLRQQKEEGAQRAIQRVRQLAGEGHDLIVAGRGGEAMAPDGPWGQALSLVRSQMAVGIIPANIGVALERQIAVTGPARAQLMREVGGLSPDAAAKVLERLRAGPVQGQAWNPAWDALTPEERAGLAEFAGSVVSARRANEEHGRAASYRADMQGIGRLMLEQTVLLQGVAGRGPGAMPMPQEQARLTEIEQSIGGIIARTGATHGLAAIGRLQGFMERQDKEARGETLAFLDMQAGQAAVAAAAAANPEIARRERELWELTRHMPFGDAARVWGAEARTATAAAAAAAKEAERVQDMIAAIATDAPVGKPVANNNENQVLAAQMIRGMVGTGASEAQAVSYVARSGVIPEGFVKRAEMAIATGEGVAFAAELHERMKRDPRAWETWQKQSTPALRAALEDLAIGMALAPRPTGDAKRDEEASARWAVTERRLLDEARTRLTQERFTGVEEAMASLGATKPEQNKALADAVVAAWDKVQLGGWRFVPFSGDAPAMTPEMRAVLERHTLLNMRAFGSVQKAAEEAARQVATSYVPTKLGMSNALGVAGEVTPGAGVVGDPGLPARMVRKEHAPESYPAPWGRGGEPGTEWITHRLPDMLREAGAPAKATEGVAAGMNAFLLPAPGRPPGQFEVWRVNRAGVLVPIGVEKGGKETALPAVVDLAAGAEKVKADRMQRDLGRERAAFEENQRQREAEAAGQNPNQPGRWGRMGLPR